MENLGDAVAQYMPVIDQHLANSEVPLQHVHCKRPCHSLNG